MHRYMSVLVDPAVRDEPRTAGTAEKIATFSAAHATHLGHTFEDGRPLLHERRSVEWLPGERQQSHFCEERRVEHTRHGEQGREVLVFDGNAVGDEALTQ